MDQQTSRPGQFSFGSTVVVPHRRELQRMGNKVAIGGRAFDLLMALLNAQGSVLSKDQLIDQIWRGRIVEENTIEGQVSALRRVLGEDKEAIRTITGRGYQFVGELVNIVTAEARRVAAPSGIRIPAEVSPIVGRERCLGEIATHAQRHRLVTLVGPGGIGKTRLAFQSARQLGSRFVDGVYLAELASASSDDFLPGMIAVALGFSPGDGTLSFDRLAPVLHTKTFLLVLDNCEHLIESASRLAERLLNIAPGAVILATSREPLRVAGECVYRVPSLDVPADDSALDAMDFSAIKLFEERAGADMFRGQEAPAALSLATQICRNLDGIPLAIELAAACVASIGLQGVASRLDDCFRLLTRGSRGALPRQQTLQATLDWSYGLLPDVERIVLERVSVFAGVFSMESALAVASCPDISGEIVFDAVIELSDKSLISPVPENGEIRYRLLETTRAYAREKLRSRRADAEASRRHAHYFLRMFEHAEQLSAVWTEIDWNAAYVPHLEDLRAAIRWGFSNEGDPQLAVDLTIASIPLSMQLALLEECLSSVGRSIEWLDRAGRAPGEREMKLHAARGMCLLCHTVGPQTMAAFSLALDLAKRTGDAAYQLLGMWGKWMCFYLNGRYADAYELAQEFNEVAMMSAWTCDRLAAYRLSGISHLLRGELHDALSNLERAIGPRIVLARAQRIRFLYDERMLSRTSQALTLWLMGRTDEAQQAARASLEDARELDHPVSLCYALSEGVCTIALLMGDSETLLEAVNALSVETRRHGISTWKARTRMWQGLVQMHFGDASAYDREIYPAMVGIGSKRFYLSLTPFVSVAAELLARSGLLGQATDLIDPALERATEIKDECSLPELMRAKAEVLMMKGGEAAELAAEALLEEALARSRRGGFMSWELRCVTSLARLKKRQGHMPAAKELLVPVYRRFATVTGSGDVDAARSLIALLG